MKFLFFLGGSVLGSVTQALAAPQSSTIVDLSELAHVAAFYGQQTLPENRFPCFRSDGSGLCARKPNASESEAELFVGIRGGVGYSALESADQHRRFPKERSRWMPDPALYPAGADSRGQIRDAWLARLGTCHILAVNRLRSQDFRPLGWLRTFIMLENNAGEDNFYGIDVWTEGGLTRIALSEGVSQRLETIVPVVGGAWVFFSERQRVKLGVAFSPSEWKSDGLRAVFQSCL